MEKRMDNFERDYIVTFRGRISGFGIFEKSKHGHLGIACLAEDDGQWFETRSNWFDAAWMQEHAEQSNRALQWLQENADQVEYGCWKLLETK